MGAAGRPSNVLPAWTTWRLRAVAAVTDDVASLRLLVSFWRASSRPSAIPSAGV